MRISAALVLATTLAAATANAAENVTISTAATSGGTLSGGVFTPTADDANLNIHDLRLALAAGDVTVTSGTSGSQTGDITIADKLTWPAGALSLSAFHSINIAAKTSVNGTAGLKLKTAHGGTLNFTNRITFQNETQTLRIQNNPYTLVSSISELAGDISGAPSGDYALMDNYDAGTAPRHGRAVVSTEFIGDFEGLGNSISNLTIHSTTSGAKDALFVWLGPNGSIEDLSLLNVNISSFSDSAEEAGLAAQSNGTISNVVVTGTVSQTGTGGPGGIVGGNSGTIQNSRANVTVSATTNGVFAGGLAAANGGTIVNCSASGDVTDNGGTTNGPTVGGLVASNTGTISLSHATGAVSVGPFGNAGGLVGTNWATIDQSYATGNVTGKDQADIGGLVGITRDNTGVDSAITNSYASGDVNGFTNTVSGGLVGVNFNSNINFSYATGAPTALGTLNWVGGVIGEDDGNQNLDDYWDTTTSGITDPSRGAGVPANDPGLTGLTNAQLKSGLPAGFGSSIWAETTGVNHGLPYLIAQPPS